MRKVFGFALVCTACTAFVLAEKPALQKIQKNPRSVQALRQAKIGTDFQLKSPWFEGSVAQSACGACVFDIFESDTPCASNPTDGALAGGYDPACNDTNGDLVTEAPSQRWYFGPTYNNPQHVNDMTMDNGDGQLYYWVSWMWFWYVGGAGTMEDCYIIIFTGDTFNSGGIGFPYSGGHDGFVIELVNTDSDGDNTNDQLASGDGGGYYTFANDVGDLGGLELPSDGDNNGAYHQIYARDFNSTLITLATTASPMLWGDKGPNPGTQNDLQWDDDTTPSAPHTNCEVIIAPDGTFDDPCELYSYAFALCPDPLGSGTAFWLGGGCSGFICADMNCDGAVNLGDVPYFVNAITDPGAWQNLVGPDCDLLCVGDINADGAVNLGDVPYFVDEVVNGNGCQ